MVYCFAHLHFSVWRNSDALNRLKPIEKTAAITYNNDGCTIFIFPTPPCRNNSNICLWNSQAVDSPRHSTRRLRICSLREPGHPAKAACRESVHRNAVAFSVQFPPPPCGAPPRPALPSHGDTPWCCAWTDHSGQAQAFSPGKYCLPRCGTDKKLLPDGLWWRVWTAPATSYGTPPLTAVQTSPVCWVSPHCPWTFS